jgi:hypothetical protein
VRAINDLVHTVATNPSAQQMAMAFINRNAAQPGAQGAPPPAAHSTGMPSNSERAAPSQRAAAPAPTDEPATYGVAPPVYHEIPVRRRGALPPGAGSQLSVVQPRVVAPAPEVTPQAPQAEVPDRREIPLRRRNHTAVASKSFSHGHLPTAVSGSGDAEVDERPLSLDDRN